MSQATIPQVIQEAFSLLKEKQVAIYGFSIAYAVEKLPWRKEKMFQGDFEVFIEKDMIAIVDKVESRVFFIRDSTAEVIEFMKKLEEVVFKVIPNTDPTSEKMEFDVSGYEIHAYVYKEEGEIGVRKSEVSLTIKQFIQDNYILKKREDVKGGGKPIDNLKEIEKRLRVKISVRGKNQVTIEGKTFDIRETLKKLGFKWDSVSKAWIKEAEDTTKSINELVAELEKISASGNTAS